MGDFRTVKIKTVENIIPNVSTDSSKDPDIVQAITENKLSLQKDEKKMQSMLSKYKFFLSKRQPKPLSIGQSDS